MIVNETVLTHARKHGPHRKKERKKVATGEPFFFERTALDECVSINIAENTRLQPWEAIVRETKKKRKEKKQL